MGKRRRNFTGFDIVLTSQRQILCFLERIYRVGYKYHLLRHISQIRDAIPQALFGRSNYQPSRKPFLLYVEVVFRSSLLFYFVNNITKNQFLTETLKTTREYYFRLRKYATPKSLHLLPTTTSKWRIG
jgi:hypothetical protein